LHDTPDTPDARTSWARSRSCRTESGEAPPCMRWRGLARPRRTAWSVAWLLPMPRAARRGRVPARGLVSLLLPRSRVSPGWSRFQRQNLSTAYAAAAQESAGAISGFFRHPRMNPQKPPSYPHFIGVIHGLIHSLSTGQGWEPGDAGTADTGNNRLIFPTGLNVITRAMGDWRCGTDGRP
jgi:hypothetical protein